MEKIKNNLITETGWELIETEYNQTQAINSGSNFMTGNGYLGYRGTMAEDTKDDYVGCIVTDTWDKADGKWEELCNVPNGLFTQIFIEGIPLSVKGDKLESFNRKLNLKSGVTSVDYTKTIDDTGINVVYHEEKFASLKDYHIIPLKIELTLGQDSTIVILEGIDGDVWNLNGNHLKNYHSGQSKNSLFLTTETSEKKQLITVACNVKLEGLDVLKTRIIKKDLSIYREMACKIKSGQKAVIYKYMSVSHSNESDDPLSKVLTGVSSINYESLVQANEEIWEEKWQKYDIKIKGNLLDETAVRFNTYHSVIATPTHASLPIGARGLSCQAYQGAAFWDQEIFNLPMYLYTDTQTAKNILKYRYDTLGGARRKARNLGFKGAYYAWISGKTGDELCPDFFFKDVLTGRPIRNHFNDWQIHITPDIVFSIWEYFQITNDEQFLLDYGAEVILESARFLSSRVVYLPTKKRYELWKIQGPDEYHENVENNAFTNYQTKYALDVALKLIEILNEKHADQFQSILDKIGANKTEISLFQDIAENIYLPKPNKKGVLEQFDGFFQLESITPAEKIKKRLIKKDEYYGWPNGIAVFTQAIKQADVIQLITMHPGLFSEEIKRANYDYYEPRTLHFSSLSPSIYSISAAQIGYVKEALKYFRKSAFIDLNNTNDPISGGTFIGGIHTAAAGAAWQMVVNGFTGFEVLNGKVCLNPQLPKEWQLVEYQVELNDSIYRIKICQDHLDINLKHVNNASVELMLNNQVFLIGEGHNKLEKGKDY
ncbi:MAG: glycosyl hydrolase family 65 protein [Bacteroidota bacterium]